MPSPAPAMSGSRLPRMFDTAAWGVNVSAPDNKGKGGAAAPSGASVTSGTTFGPSSSLSDSTGQLQMMGVTSPARGGRDRNGNGAGHLPIVPSKMQVLEQYIARFPLVAPQLAAPITAVLDGGTESRLGASAAAAAAGGNKKGVKFAGDHEAPHTPTKDNNSDDGKDKDGENDGDGGHGGGGEQDAAKKAALEISTRRQAREAAKQSYELLRRQKVDAYLQMSERNLRKVRRENETLSALARLTQSNALVNDERYEKALEALRAEAELADELRQVGFGPMMAECAERIDAIQRDMQKLVVETNKRTIEELAQARANFEKELEAFQRELEAERNSGLSTKLEWIEKNRQLHRAVTEELFASDDLAREHSALEAQHRKRRLDASLTTDEVALLEETVEKARQHNARLKDKLGTLECELSLAQARDNRAKAERAEAIGAAAAAAAAQQHRTYSSLSQHSAGSSSDNATGGGGDQHQQPQRAFSQLPPRPVSASLSRPTSATATGRDGTVKPQQHNASSGGVPPAARSSNNNRPPTAQSTVTGTSSSGSTDEAVAAEAHGLFARISQTIAIESRNLQTARYAHTEALKQRTELEVYLKQAILTYQGQLQNLHYSMREGLKADSGGTGVYAKGSLSLAHGGSMAATTTTTTAAAATSKKRALLLQDIANSDGCHRVKKVEPTVFTVEDRQTVVDSLLSLPRVLTLLFDPVSAAKRLRRKQQEKQARRMTSRQQQRQQQPNDDDDDAGNTSDASSEASSSPNGKPQRDAGSGMASADAALYDDLAKLGVDVVGSRAGFLFHGVNAKQSAPRGSTNASVLSSAATGRANNDGDDDSQQNPPFVGAPPPPMTEDELWERWSKWSREAEKEFSSSSPGRTKK